VFHAAIREANEAFRTTVADSRDELLVVLKDPASTAEQRMAAIDTYKDEVRQAREVRRTAVKAAIAEYKAARKAARAAFREAIGK
jgi:predicted RND superfamily exporter protein